MHSVALLGNSFTIDALLDNTMNFTYPDPIDTLAMLYEKSLLTIDSCGEKPIYRMFDTTRAYILNVTKT